MDVALDAEHVPQADVQAIGDYHQPRRDRLVIGKHDLLPIVRGRDRNGLGHDMLDVRRNLRADGVDQGVIEDADLPARRLIEDLPLFSATRAVPASPPADPAAEAVMKALAALSPDEMSPRQAMDALYALKLLAKSQN